MQEFSQGICDDGAAILCNGKAMSIEEILKALRALDLLVELKEIKERLKSKPNGRTMDYYNEQKPVAWSNAKDALGL